MGNKGAPAGVHSIWVPVRSASSCTRDGSAISDLSHAVPLQISSVPRDNSVAGRVLASAPNSPARYGTDTS